MQICQRLPCHAGRRAAPAPEADGSGATLSSTAEEAAATVASARSPNVCDASSSASGDGASSPAGVVLACRLDDLPQLRAEGRTRALCAGAAAAISLVALRRSSNAACSIQFCRLISRLKPSACETLRTSSERQAAMSAKRVTPSEARCRASAASMPWMDVRSSGAVTRASISHASTARRASMASPTSIHGLIHRAAWPSWLRLDRRGRSPSIRIGMQALSSLARTRFRAAMASVHSLSVTACTSSAATSTICHHRPEIAGVRLHQRARCVTAARQSIIRCALRQHKGFAHRPGPPLDADQGGRYGPAASTVSPPTRR